MLPPPRPTRTPRRRCAVRVDDRGTGPHTIAAVPYIPAWGCRVAGGCNPPERKDEGLPERPLPQTPALPGRARRSQACWESAIRSRRDSAAGAFGEVYRAHDVVLGRDVAIKRVRIEAFVDPGQLEEVKRRFVREAQVAGRLGHATSSPSTRSTTAPTTPFIVMELVVGTR